jgi:type I restriction enzyme S subunit
LKRAFAGALVPQDPADEPAAALLERLRASRDQPEPKRPKKPRPDA